MGTSARDVKGMASSPVFLTLFVTFILGFAIGFSLCYAWRLGEQPSSSPTTAAKSAPSDSVAAGTAPQSVGPAETGILADLTPGRYLILGIAGTGLSPEYAELLSHVRPGAVLFRPENVESPEQSTRLAVEVRQAAGEAGDPAVFPLIAADPEALAERLGRTGPSMSELVAARDTAGAREAGRTLAVACGAYGIQVAFAPVLASPSPTEAAVPAVDTDAVAALAMAYADGMIAGGVLPVLKNYPCATVSGQTTPARLEQDVAGLAELLLPFTEALNHGVPGIRVEHATVPALDVWYPDRPASLSPVLVRRMLRSSSAPYDGVIVADDLAAPCVAAQRGLEDAVVEALAAGCDAVILTDTDPARIRAACAAIARAVQDGILPRERLDESKRRLEGWQARVRDPKPLEGPLPDIEPLRVAASEPPALLDMESAPPPAPEPSEEASAPAFPEEAAPAEAPAAPAPEPGAEAPPAVTVPEDKTEEPPTEASSEEAEPAGTERIVYTIQKGDGLYQIARRFGVSVKDIVAWNNLRDEDIKWGYKLVIHAPRAADPEPAPAEATPAAPPPAPIGIAEPSQEPPAAPAEAAASSQEPPVEAPPAEIADTEKPQTETPPGSVGTADPPGTEGLVKITYEVQRGDMLSRLAAKFGVKQKDIMKWSHLSNPNLQWGRRLTLYVDPATAERLGYGASAEGTTSKEVVKREHTVAAGETLDAIAGQYGLTERDIAAWNDLSDGKVREGQVLTLYLPLVEVEP